MKEIDALLEQLKKAGVAPEVVHVKISVSDAKEIASLQKELKAAGVSSEVHINLQVGPGGAGAAATIPTSTSGAGATGTPSTTTTGAGATGTLSTTTTGEGATETTSTTDSDGPDSIPSDSFEVEVATDKVLFRFYKDTEGGKNKQGKPVMLIREPRIRLDQGDRFKVSATHKEGSRDKGDGIILADGGTYYLVTDPRYDAGKHNSDKNAAKFDDGEIKLFVRTKDVTRV